MVPYSWYQRDDYHVVTVSKYLQYMSVKDSCISGNMSYMNYSTQKTASVSPSVKKKKLCLHQAKLGIAEVPQAVFAKARNTGSTGSNNERHLAG